MANKHTGLALRFISGKYQGNEYPLPANKEIVIGRGSELDIVLVEDMISRRHAKIVTGEDYVILQDLGSTNGSFVNGERIRKQRIQEGDRILLGTSILKLVPFKENNLLRLAAPATDAATTAPASSPGLLGPGSEHALPSPDSAHQQATMHLPAFQVPNHGDSSAGMAATAPPPASSPFGPGANIPATQAPSASPMQAPADRFAPPLQTSAQTAPQTSAQTAPPPAGNFTNEPHRASPDLGQPSMTGSLSDTPLHDLLELFATSRKNGVLVVKGTKEGRLHFRDGQIVYAITENNTTLSPLRAAYRLLAYKTGTFELYPPYDQEIQHEILEDAMALLQQATQQSEQIKRYQNELPSPIHNLSIQHPLRSSLRDLRPDYLDTLQSIFNYGILDTILNKSNFSDLDTYQHIAFLYKHGYIKVH